MRTIPTPSLLRIRIGMVAFLILLPLFAQTLESDNRVLLLGTAADTHRAALEGLIREDPISNGLNITVDSFETDDVLDSYFSNSSGNLSHPSNINPLQQKLDEGFDVILINPSERHIRVSPELEMEGVRLVERYVRDSGAEVMLIVPTHDPSYTLDVDNPSSPTDVKERVYRIVDAYDLTGVPVGMTWETVLADQQLTATDTTMATPNFHAVNTYATTIFCELFETSAASSTYRHGGISEAEFALISAHAHTTWQEALTATHYTGDYVGMFSPFPDVIDVEDQPTAWHGASTEALTNVEFANIYERKGVTPISANTHSEFTWSRNYDFLVTRGIWWDSTVNLYRNQDPGNDLRIMGMHYKNNNMSTMVSWGLSKSGGSQDWYAPTTSSYIGFAPTPLKRTVPHTIGFIRHWLEKPDVSTRRYGDGHLNENVTMVMASMIYTMTSGGEHPLEGVTQLDGWTGPQRYAAALGYATVAGLGQLKKLDMAPVATGLPRVHMTANTSNPLTLPGVDFNGLPVTVEIVTPPTNGSLIPNGNDFTYTPNADFCGIDSVTYRVSNGIKTSLPLTVMLPVGPYIEPTHSGTTILADNFDDENFDDWTASEGFFIINSANSSSKLTWIDGFPRPYEGTAAVGITGGGTLEKAFSTVGYENLRLTLQLSTGLFRAGTGTVSPPDQATVQWFDGSTWHDLIVHGNTYATNRLFQKYDVVLPAAAEGNPSFKIRLITIGNGRDCFIDSIHLSGDVLPFAPIASGASYQLEMNQSLGLTLEANDFNNDPLTFQILDGPSHGSLTGTGDQRTYTPINNFTGVDTFTFTANDGGLDSNIATITITIRDNTAPIVTAGPDQTVTIAPEDLPQPGLWFGEVPGNINMSDPNPKSMILVDVASRTEDGINTNTTEIFTGQIFDADGVISFTEQNAVKTRIWFNGELVLSDDKFLSRTYSGTLNGSPGWNDIEIRISNKNGDGGPFKAPGIAFDPEGGETWNNGEPWQTLVDPGDGSLLRVPGAGRSFTLSGASVTDAEEDALNITWSQISGPKAFLDDPTQINPTATVLELGVYVLRLTVDDGLVQVHDQITITVTEPSAEMEQFLVDNGLPANTDMNIDSDGDGVSNRDEFLAMTNPNDASSVFSIEFNASGEVTSPIPMVAGRYYRLSWRASLASGSWSPVPGYEGTTSSDGSPMSVAVTADGFYRLEVSTSSF